MGYGPNKQEIATINKMSKAHIGDNGKHVLSGIL